MVLSRAAFGVRGNRLPSALSWLLTVGWETVLVILATLATATVLDRLGWGGGTGTKLVAHGRGRGRRPSPPACSASTSSCGCRPSITIATAALTVVYIALVARRDQLGRGVRAAGRLAAGLRRRARLRDDRLRARLGQRGRRLLPLPAAVGVQPRRGRLDRRSAARSARWCCCCSACCSPARQPELSEAIGADPIGALTTRAADLVPGAVRAGRGARAGRRRGAGHLLVRAGPARRPASGSRATCRRAGGRRADGDRHDLRGLRRRRLHRPVPGLPDHARGADRGLVRGLAGRRARCAGATTRSRSST